MFCLYLLHKKVTKDHTVGVVYNLQKHACVSFLIALGNNKTFYVNSNKYIISMLSVILYIYIYLYMNAEG